eukprot:TRINITY_DN49244_c0_g1_i1.p1 TRINITY_DN49244_c0_g1~~TRINITY_DN49244_c0_g1_i1.p1  ORF type:complete len:503 (+),score=41.69 TRINITY_DN49244_c0_g1_i1:62-1510(+)
MHLELFETKALVKTVHDKLNDLVRWAQLPAGDMSPVATTPPDPASLAAAQQRFDNFMTQAYQQVGGAVQVHHSIGGAATGGFDTGTSAAELIASGIPPFKSKKQLKEELHKKIGPLMEECTSFDRDDSPAGVVCCHEFQKSKKKTRPRAKDYYKVCHDTIAHGIIRRHVNDTWNSTKLKGRPNEGWQHPKVPDVYNHSGIPLLVVTPIGKDDLNWLKEVKHPFVMYDTEKPSSEPYNVPENKGLEALKFIKYILDHYCLLPDYVAFIHGHVMSWHNIDHMPMYEVLNGLRVGGYEYASFNGIHCRRLDKAKDVEYGFKMWHETGMDEQWSKWPRADNATHKGFPSPNFWFTCCAQFAVSKERILAVPHALWLSMYNWILTTSYKNAFSGRAFEYTWHVIFGEDWNYSPPVLECFLPTAGWEKAADDVITALRMWHTSKEPEAWYQPNGRGMGNCKRNLLMPLRVVGDPALKDPKPVKVNGTK